MTDILNYDPLPICMYDLGVTITKIRDKFLPILRASTLLGRKKNIAGVKLAMPWFFGGGHYAMKREENPSEFQNEDF